MDLELVVEPEVLLVEVGFVLEELEAVLEVLEVLEEVVVVFLKSGIEARGSTLIIYCITRYLDKKMAPRAKSPTMIMKMKDQITTPAHILTKQRKMKLITMAIRAEQQIINQAVFKSLIAFINLSELIYFWIIATTSAYYGIQTLP